MRHGRPVRGKGLKRAAELDGLEMERQEAALYRGLVDALGDSQVDQGNDFHG